MKTLADLARSENATIEDHHKDLVIHKLHPAGESTMYFSGNVIRHIDVCVEGSGLNKTGTWPFYLVEEDGKNKILSA